jgi:hypothetical protein
MMPFGILFQIQQRLGANRSDVAGSAVGGSTQSDESGRARMTLRAVFLKTSG